MLNAGVTYNNAESSWDWDFTDRPDMNAAGLSLDPTAGVTTLYSTVAQNNLIDSYSDLSYEQYEFTLGATYNFTEAFYTTASGTYNVFESEEEYVYGDEDGKSYSGYLAVGYKF